MFEVQIYCYNKCGVVLEELNPHLPFGNHLLGKFFLCFFHKNKRIFYIFHFVDEGVQKSSLVFNLDLEGVC